MNRSYGTEVQRELKSVLVAIDRLPALKTFNKGLFEMPIEKIEKLSEREHDDATKKLCDRILELLNSAEKSGFLTKFEKRVLEDSVLSINEHASTISAGYPSFPSYKNALDAIKGCQRLRAMDMAA